VSPAALLRPCSAPRCPNLVPGGRCQDHRRCLAASRRRDEPGRKWYATARWAALRKRVLDEDPLCAWCQAKGYVRGATDVDHVVPHRGDPRLFWDRSNLQGLCAECHGEKTRRGE
jgi:5-methylcytosine-specific restriction protein A